MQIINSLFSLFPHFLFFSLNLIFFVFVFFFFFSFFLCVWQTNWLTCFFPPHTFLFYIDGGMTTNDEPAIGAIYKMRLGSSTTTPLLFGCVVIWFATAVGRPIASWVSSFFFPRASFKWYTQRPFSKGYIVYIAQKSCYWRESVNDEWLFYSVYICCALHVTAISINPQTSWNGVECLTLTLTLYIYAI